MPKFAANLTMLFTERPFLERFEAAHKSGFKAVEFLFPYAWPANELKSLLDKNHLELVLHNLPPGDWDAGERGIACHPDRIEEFKEGVAMGIAYANILGVKQLNCLAGKLPIKTDLATVQKTLVNNFKYAANEFKKHGLRLLIEPINFYDVPGFYLNHTQQALDLIDEVGADNVFIQYDIYHMQRMEGEIAATIERLLPKIAHIQIADNPGRFEPGTGELNYAFLFKHLDQIGYQGSVGCEYKPKTTTEAGLGWIKVLN
jgi:hydroxypyruvate isomerase